jgi:hypothetical protein
VTAQVIQLFPDEGPVQEALPFWLTVSKVDSRCPQCKDPILTGCDVVYRHEPRKSLCRKCADAEGIEYRPSKAWRQLEEQLTDDDGMRLRPPGAA